MDLEGTRLQVNTPDGRVLDVVVDGDPEAVPLLFHGGQPSGAVLWPDIAVAAAAHGLRFVTYSRPGYGRSTLRAEADRPGAVVDDVADAVAILDHLGADGFVTLGWSGGGPRALACAALLPGRCRGATSLAGVAPYDAGGLDWFHGMAQENVDDYTLAAQGPDALRPNLQAQVDVLKDVSGAQVAEALGGLVPPVDVRALEGDMAEVLAASMREAFLPGVEGFLDDALATCRPWGFDLASISVPVEIWQGSEDAMVPMGHGAWLSQAVPGAESHLVEGEGHLSIGSHMDQMVATLAGRARA